jgi:hypothetical protein
MVAALHGRREAHNADAKRDLLLAYHTGAFAGAAFAGKLKPFKEYLTETEPRDDRPLQHAKAIAFFHTLKARGFPVEITRTVN